MPVLKVDRLFEWKRGPNSGIVDTVKKQKRNTKQEFDERVQVVLKEFSEQVSEYATCCMGGKSCIQKLKAVGKSLKSRRTRGRNCVQSNFLVVRGSCSLGKSWKLREFKMVFVRSGK